MNCTRLHLVTPGFSSIRILSLWWYPKKFRFACRRSETKTKLTFNIHRKQETAYVDFSFCPSYSCCSRNVFSIEFTGPMPEWSAMRGRPRRACRAPSRWRVWSGRWSRPGRGPLAGGRVGWAAGQTAGPSPLWNKKGLLIIWLNWF